MTMRIILMLVAVAVPVLMGLACHACRGDRPARFGPTVDRILSRSCGAARGLVAAWMLIGFWAFFLSRPSSPWVMVLGVSGLMFGSLFGMTVSLLECFEGRPKPKAKPSRRFALKGPLWDAELDCGNGR
jgi:hypothetical protein